jgi:hypothetical protein
MSRFSDKYAKLVFNATDSLYGDLCSWVSIDGMVNFTGLVCFQDPTAKELVETAEFVQVDPFMEFLRPAFPGLKDLVDAQSPERVTIAGVPYYVTAVHQLSDGSICKAYLQLV